MCAMDFQLTAEQREIQALARDFARERIEPHASEWDREHHFPRELFTQLAELGLMGVCVPDEYGGAGADFVSYILVLEELSRADAGVGVTVAVHTSATTLPILTPCRHAAPPPYSCTRVRASKPGGVSSCRDPSARRWTRTARPASAGRGSIQTIPSSSRSTTTHENHGSAVAATCSIEIGERHEPYGATVFATNVLITGQNTYGTSDCEPRAYQTPNARLTTPSAGASCPNDRRTGGRESASPNALESSDIDTAVKNANTPRQTIASAWLGIDASSSTPTPAVPPIP